MRISYRVHDVAPYISWSYFFHAWGFDAKFAAIANVHACQACQHAWISSFDIADQPRANEVIKLFNDATVLLRRLDAVLTAETLVGLYEANADGNDIALANGIRIPLLRQQSHYQPDGPYLCLADYIRPSSQHIPDQIGVFAATVDDDKLTHLTDDPYDKLLAQTLCDRLVEAAVEKMHQQVRKDTWGYAKEEDLAIPELLLEHFQGIRPAVGYPSLPDQSVNFILDELLDFGQIGIKLTENGAMQPHASVSGLMFAHPKAKYFSIGKIGEDQLADYSARRGYPIETMRKFLSRNL